MQEDVDRPVVRRHPDRAQHRLRVLDVDEAEERDAQEPDRFLAVDECDHARSPFLLERPERAHAARREHAALQHRQDDDDHDENSQDRSEIHAGEHRSPGLHWPSWTDSSTGTGSASQSGSELPRGSRDCPRGEGREFAVALVTAVAVATGVIAALATIWAVFGTLGGVAIGVFSFRHLARAAVPAAALAVALLALVPAAGYLEALLAPLFGERLRRRASGRYAGLRVLAKD